MARRAWRYWEPSFLADQVCEMNPVWPWGGHRRFAYDLVRWMRPARIAELGVHWGTSFFTFAQAIRDGRMRDTELIGVDTFEGEDHAGHYGPEVYETVQRIVREHFPKQATTLHRMYFRDALARVEDGGIDLLHIDGLHTLEAVRDDFESWLPKLAPEGVVLFHDVAPDTGYGSTDYWNQVVERYPGFAFEHSWGLGVLFPKGESRLAELRADGLEDKLIAYPALARAERSGHELRDLGTMAKSRLETIHKQGETIAELRQQLAELRASTVASAAHERVITRAEAAEQLARERLEVMQGQSQKLRDRDARIEALQAQIEAARQLAVERLEALKRASDRAFQAEKSLAGLMPRTTAAEAARDELRERVGDLRERVGVQDQRLGELREALQASQQRNDQLAERNAALREGLAASNAAVEQLREQAEAARAAHAAIDGRLADLAAHIAAVVGSHARSREESAAGLAALAGAVDQARRAGEAAANALANRLARLDTDTDLLAMRAEHLEDVVGGHRAALGEHAARDAAEVDWLTGERTAPAAPPTRRPRHP